MRRRPPRSTLTTTLFAYPTLFRSHAATTGIGGVSRHHEDMVESAARQILDVFAPTNFLATNPLLQRKIVETGGRCVVDGFRNLLEDMQRSEERRVGEGCVRTCRTRWSPDD